MEEEKKELSKEDKIKLLEKAIMVAKIVSHFTDDKILKEYFKEECFKSLNNLIK